MAHVSKILLPKHILTLIENEFFNATGKGGRKILAEVLTDVERIMIAKRFMAILMLIEEHSYYRIDQVLGIRPATSRRIHQIDRKSVV